MAIGTPVSLGFEAPSGTVTTISLVAAANILAKDLVVVGFQYDDAVASTGSSVSDGTNTYTKILRAIKATNVGVTELWFCANCIAVTSPTITVTMSAGTVTPAMQAGRVSGVAVVPLDQSASAQGTGTTPSVTSGTLSQAKEIAFGYCMGRNTFTETPPAGWTELNIGDSQNPQTSFLDYIIVNATTALTFNPTISASAGWSTIIATFKARPGAMAAFTTPPRFYKRGF